MRFTRFWEVSNTDDAQSKFEQIFYQMALDLKDQNRGNRGSIITKKSLGKKTRLAGEETPGYGCCRS